MVKPQRSSLHSSGRLRIFLTGGTGYVGRHLIPPLIERGHEVKALVRPRSENKLPSGCRAITGDALNQPTFSGQIAPADTFVQLVGVPHPSPAKAAQFREIDLVSVRESVAAAIEARVEHFVYVSVAQPAPAMKAYLAVRAEGESLIRASGLRATILRPWYILGPGHRWPYLLLPMYWIFEQIPATGETARRIGLVTLKQMVQALLRAIEEPPQGIRIWEVPEIRAGGGLDG
jgi:uncharacterized protein YbjT (DUF2867 family)